ncbi:MAG TPA: T9SS type A sorting domain-containing protein [Bacteroidia bacterium]|nr:T9SS type A sorting domain-containing protein [Bacteroidia bacterium]
MRKILLFTSLLFASIYQVDGQIMTTPYSEDFETGSPAWTASMINPDSEWQLGTPAYGSTTGAHSGTNCWDINLDTNYFNNAYCQLLSPGFNFSGLTGIKISFWQNNKTEQNWDGVVLQYITDTISGNWTTLGTVNDPGGINWYNYNLINSSQMPAWSGNTGGWIQSSLVVPNFADTSDVWFRFLFTSDASVMMDGFSIDDFSIEAVAINVISGSLFSDSNANGVIDAGDLPFANVPVTCSSINGTATLTSNSAGYYSFVVDSGVAYTITPQNPIYTTIAPSSYAVTFNGTNQTSSNNDFLLGIIPGVIEVGVNATSWGVRPGFNHNMYLNYFNNGTTVTSGSVQVNYDPSFTVVNASDPYTVTGPNAIEFQYANLIPGENRSIYCTFFVDSTLAVGVLTSSTAIITPTTGDTLPTNNRDTLNIITTNSLDPNDKLVDPKGDITPTQVANGIDMKYIINFQNTGTAEAFHVNIYDQLDADLDVSTFEITGSSHPITSWTMDLNRMLHFSFANINLPVSSTNEAGSHGFICYKIKPKPFLAVGTLITNEAAIYFDNNLPVLTNLTTNEVVIPTGIAEVGNTSELIIYPNPNSGNFFVSTDENYSSWQVVNAIGHVVQSGSIDANTQLIEMHTEKLPNGIYLVRMNGSNGEKSGTFLKK